MKSLCPLSTRRESSIHTKQRACGIAGAATQVVAHARQDGCERIRRDGRTGPSVTNPQDRRRRTSQSRAPKSDGEAEKPRRACRTRHEAKQNQQGPTPRSRKNRQTTEQGALEDTAEETSSAHVRRHGERHGTMPKKRSTKKTDESKRAERKKLMETDTYRQGDTPTQPEPKISNRRGRPAPCRIAATQPHCLSSHLL